MFNRIARNPRHAHETNRTEIFHEIQVIGVKHNAGVILHKRQILPIVCRTLAGLHHPLEWIALANPPRWQNTDITQVIRRIGLRNNHACIQQPIIPRVDGNGFAPRRLRNHFYVMPVTQLAFTVIQHGVFTLR